MAKLLNLLPWRRRRMKQDLDRELQHHMDYRVVELMHSGMSTADARRQAGIEFGSLDRVQEEVRDTWTWRWLDHLVRDAQYAGRTLRRSPAFTATAMLSLALGIGASTAMFSLLDQAVLQRLPVREPERLVQLSWNGNSLSAWWGSANKLSYPLCRDMDEQRRLFDGAFCRHRTTVTFSTGEEPHRIQAEIVSGSFFPVIGVRPHLGRLIGRSDDLEPGEHPVVVLSFNYWKNNLGGAPDVIGSKVLVDNYPMTVIGVAPERFLGVDPIAGPALWLPAMMTQEAAALDPGWDRLLDRRAAWMHVFARLRPDVTVEQAKVRLEPWFEARIVEDTRLESFPDATAEQRDEFLSSTLDVLPASRGVSEIRGALERPLWVLMGGTVLFILLAALNLAGLLLARGAVRGRELATRVALGASRRRITGQLLVESALIALGGGLLGFLAAPAVSIALLAFLSPDAALSFRIDYRVLLFAILVTLVTAGLCGLAPVLQTGRIRLAASLNERSRIATAGGVRLRKAIVVGQIAFTLVLLIGAGLFVRTVAQLRENVGFRSSNLVMFNVDPPSIGYSNPDARRVMHELFLRLQEVPGVEAVAVANTSLLAGGSFSFPLTVQADERVVTDGSVYGLRVTPGFFSTLGIRLIAGRDFDERDTRIPENSDADFPSAIVNGSFARRYFGDRDPVGHRLGRGNQPGTPTSIEIIGVVEDFSYRSLRMKESEHVFFSFWGRQSEDGAFYLKVRGAPEEMFATIRAAAAEIDPTLPVAPSTFQDQIDWSLGNERMLATLSTAFGAMALFLSIVGLYGVMSFVVTRRTQELGVRLALGATRSAVLWLILRQALVMVSIGTAIALACAWALGRLIEAQLFGVQPVDGLTLTVASSLLALAALGAALRPAWRAASLSPTDALRFE